VVGVVDRVEWLIFDALLIALITSDHNPSRTYLFVVSSEPIYGVLTVNYVVIFSVIQRYSAMIDFKNRSEKREIA